MNNYGPGPFGLLFCFFILPALPFMLLFNCVSAYNEGRSRKKMFLWQQEQRNIRYQQQQYAEMMRRRQAESVLRYKQRKCHEWEQGDRSTPPPYDLSKPPVFRGCY